MYYYFSAVKKLKNIFFSVFIYGIVNYVFYKISCIAAKFGKSLKFFHPALHDITQSINHGVVTCIYTYEFINSRTECPSSSKINSTLFFKSFKLLFLSIDFFDLSLLFPINLFYYFNSQQLFVAICFFFTLITSSNQVCKIIYKYF